MVNSSVYWLMRLIRAAEG